MYHVFVQRKNTSLNNPVGLMIDTKALIENKTPFSIIFMAFDDFKNINDQYGHTASDNYLIAFANTTKRLFEKKGVLYRLSEDEFVFIF